MKPAPGDNGLRELARMYSNMTPAQRIRLLEAAADIGHAAQLPARSKPLEPPYPAPNVSDSHDE